MGNCEDGKNYIMRERWKFRLFRITTVPAEYRIYSVRTAGFARRYGRCLISMRGHDETDSM